MGTVIEAAGIMEQQQCMRGIRVVLACNELLNRAAMCRAFGQVLDICVVGEATDWQSLVQHIDEFVPELVVANHELVTRALTEFPGPFPLFLQIGETKASDVSRVIACIPASASPEKVFETVQTMKVAILEAKWRDLMQMLQAFRPQTLSQNYPRMIEISGRTEVDRVPTESIRCITAAKNYVRLETEAGEFQTRSPISDISARLDPAKFLRIHRSVIVNKNAIASVVHREGSFVGVVLRDGRRFPIGSTYRQAATQALESRSQQGQ